jgi:lysine biosynthesis protein LysW
MPTSICPECSEEVFVDAESEQGDGVVCDECGSSLVVVGLDPIELDLRDETEADDPAGRDDFGSYDYDDQGY